MNKIRGKAILCLLIAAVFVMPISAMNNEIKNVVFATEKTVDDDCGCVSYNRDGIGYTIKSNPQIPSDPTYTSPKPAISGLPDYFNWADFGGQDWTTPAKNQYIPKTCYSCWAFAALGIFESVINIKEGSAVIDPDFSEQYLLSCLPNATLPEPPGTGCDGGYPNLALQYMMETTENGNGHNGAIFEECFPYQADDDIPCSDICPDWVEKLVPIKDCFEWWSSGSPEEIRLIKSQILEKGPVVAGMLSTSDFEDWGYTHHDPDDYYPYYKADGYNHVVIIVGWKDDPFISRGGYWLCKNSYGQSFGYNGFFNIVYGSLLIDSSSVDWVDYDPNSYEWPSEPDPPGMPDIDGPTSGNITQAIDYVFKATDPNDKDVKLFISWGDGNTEWTDYYTSNEDVIVQHTWNKKGNYTVMALAMNTNDSIGPWGTLTVTMPETYDNPLWTLIEKLFDWLEQMFGREILPGIFNL